MSGRGHLSPERLAALAYAPGVVDNAPGSRDHLALDHLAACDRCSGELARLSVEADAVREAACNDADAVFDVTMLDAQRTRILDRLAHLGQAARVLAFPVRSREVVLPASSASRRWVSVAAAAGLVIGLVAGQLLNLMPSNRGALRDDVIAAPLRTPADSGAVLLPASTASPALSDHELWDEVETAILLRRAAALQAIDDLTPTAADLLASR